MIRSMTGFGAGRARQGDEELAVEVRSVNAKFCEVKPRLPRELSALEVELVRQVKSRLQRGSVEVFVKRLAGAARSSLQPRIDLALAREYAALWQQLARELGQGDAPPSPTELMAAEGVLILEERAADLEHAREALGRATALALAELEKMREAEGRALAEDLLARAATLRKLAGLIAASAPQVVRAYRDRLQARMLELTEGQGVDAGRIAQEAALFADRSDVAEELSRLASHLDQFEKLVAGDEPAGRRMEFLVQEMGREVNTTGSKSQSAALAATVVELKAELERIREQVANVE